MDMDRDRGEEEGEKNMYFFFYSNVLESFFSTLHGSVQFLLPLFLLLLSFQSLDLALAIVHPVFRDVS